MRNEWKWRYYNHAILPTSAPHETADVSPMRQKGFWKSVPGGGFPLLARWTSDFDCQEETDWWYIIKDQPFQISDVKANYRYKINKGRKSFTVKAIDPAEHARALYQVLVAAYAAYPSKYRPTAEFSRFAAGLSGWTDGVTLAAFSNEDGSMAGYTHAIVNEGYISLSAQKTRPDQEKLQVNAALVYGLLDHFHQQLAAGAYVLDGERSILHETNFHDYLEKYFGFRKAYCRLHVRYRPGVRQVVACLYPIRGLLQALGGLPVFYQINSVLKMEEIARKTRNANPVKEVV